MIEGRANILPSLVLPCLNVRSGGSQVKDNHSVAGAENDPTESLTSHIPPQDRDTKAISIRLFLLSFLLLLLEVANIRWVAGHVPVIGYYANFILLSTFVGFGLGCLDSELPFQTSGTRYLGSLAGVPFLLLLLAIMTTIWGLAPVSLSPHDAEMIWASTPGATIDILGALMDSLRSAVASIQAGTLRKISQGNYLPVEFVALLFFALNAFLFYPVGRELGRCFSRMTPLRAYSVNVAGSLVGVLTMLIFSTCSLPPLAWYSAASAVLIFLLVRQLGIRALPPTLALLVLLPLLVLLDGPVFWSPYSKIRIEGIDLDANGRGAFRLSIAEHFHQAAIDYSDRPDLTTQPPGVTLYDLPFLILKERPRKVLILGAGTGNDVAGALRAGVASVFSVEIDPTILSLGRRLHPENPYGDPRVTIINDDGRRFLEHTNEVFDLIIYGLLDSHGLFSNLSSVRLDSFIYTEEAFFAARSRLKPGGAIIISYAAVNEWLGPRLLALARKIIGRAEAYESAAGFIIIAGPGLPTDLPQSLYGLNRVTEPVSDVLTPTDNWPFLYLRNATIPRHYLIVVFVVLAACLMLTGIRGDARKGWNWPFFWSGAGFLLLESVSVTRAAVLFGSTWMVNGLVFSAVLIAILLANLVTHLWRGSSVKIGAVGLSIALLISWLVSPSQLLGLPDATRWIMAGAYIGLPIFFASLIFAHLMASTTQGSFALGTNLVGAVAGGFTEYLSMALGFSALIPIASLFYALIYVSIRFRRA
jgi:hypothetical protein